MLKGETILRLNYQNQEYDPRKSQSASTENPAKSPFTYAVISNGCIINNLTGVLRGIQVASTDDPQKYQEVLSWSVHRAMYNDKTGILRHLLNHEGARPNRLPPGTVAVSAAIPLLQFYLRRPSSFSTPEVRSLAHVRCITPLQQLRPTMTTNIRLSGWLW